MKIFCLFYISLISISFEIDLTKSSNFDNSINKLLQSYSKSNNNKESSNELKDLFLNYTLKIIDDNMTKFLIKDQNCTAVLSDINNDIKKLFDYLVFNGKHLNDIGLEKDCKESKFYYFLIQINVTGLLDEYFINSDVLYLYKYLQKDQIFLGMCLPINCSNFFEEFFNETTNKKFYDNVYKKETINNIITYFPQRTTRSKSFLGEYIIIFLIIYVALRILVNLLGNIYFKYKEDKQSSEDSINSEASSMHSGEFEESLNFSVDKKEIFNNKNKSSTYNDSKTKDFSKTKYFFYILYKIMNLKSQLKYVITAKNKYYDDTNLDYINFLRAFSFFFIIFNHNIYALIKIPHRDFVNYYFYTGNWFWVVKLSTFFSDIWILLDGFVMSFKLMNYLKKNRDYSFKSFLKFYGIVFTKFVIFIIVYFFIHLKLEEFRYLFKNTPVIDYFIKNINNNRYCYNNSLITLIPFYYEYLKLSGNIGEDVVYCYRFADYYSNEFFCFTLMVFIFYIANKLQSKIFDYSIAILIFLNMLLCFLTSRTPGDQYNLTWTLGDRMSISYLYMFINTYVLGIFTGLVYFYYKDIITALPTNPNFKYIPFKFCFELMKVLDKSSITMKNFLFYFSWTIIFILANSLTFLISYTYGKSFFYRFDFDEMNPTTYLNLKPNFVMEFLFIYEKKIFIIFFIITILVALLYPKITTFSKLLDSCLIFIPFSKIDISSFCILDGTIYFFYCTNNSQVFMTNSVIFIMSTIVFIFIWLVSILLNILFEIPLRIIYKKLYRSNKIISPELR